MNQQEFYNLPEVVEQINIQKCNPHGSVAHKTAFDEITNIANKRGVGDEYRKSGGHIYD